jgi:hypothetical protein
MKQPRNSGFMRMRPTIILLLESTVVMAVYALQKDQDLQEDGGEKASPVALATVISNSAH